jgi:lysophospholipase L1-like esterase
MDDRRVLFFGDSFVAGAGDPRGCGWVGRVTAACWPLTPYNLGVRGETSVQVAARWQAEAWPRLRAGARSAAVFSVGANDACGERPGEPPRVPLEQSRAALGELLDAARLLELPAFVVGPPPVGDPLADARVRELTEAFGALCAARGTPYVPVAEQLLRSGTWLAEAAAGDGAHPGAGGYDELARLILAGGIGEWIAAL